MPSGRYSISGRMKKHKFAAALGSKGGKARAKKLTKEKLSEIGKKGAITRWNKKKI